MRRAGILMPISSLPSPNGIGTMGSEARKFADFLAKAGQSCWQILPVGPTSYGDSPYQAYSSFAGNPYFIDLYDLVEEYLLEEDDFVDLNWGDDVTSVDYEKLNQQRFDVLRLACTNVWKQEEDKFRAFCTQQADWLEDYALFMALKGKNKGIAWYEWPEEERLRKPAALSKAKEELAEEIRFWQGVQYLFFRQWDALKQYVNEKGVSIIGDLPIYVAGDSADVWANPDQFQLDKEGKPTEVAGCPPDAFSEDGQLWGNPLFDWENMKKDGYTWWLKRIEAQFKIYDVLRIDHFRGFDEDYAIPYGDKTARNGRWRPGPGMDFFRKVNEKMGEREIIAEDLGFLTDSVRKLLEDTGYPGMKVMEFAFSNMDTGSDYLPHCYTSHCVVYPGTHDNDTIVGWMENSPKADVEFAKAYLRMSEDEGWHWGMMRGAWASPADLTIIQFQDVLGLGSEARMNTPSTVGANWKWRTKGDTFTAELAEKLYQDMRVYQRLPKKPAKEEEPAQTEETAEAAEAVPGAEPVAESAAEVVEPTVETGAEPAKNESKQDSVAEK